MQTLSRSAPCGDKDTFSEVPFQALGTCHEEIAAMLEQMSELADEVEHARWQEGLKDRARAAHLFFSSHAIDHHLDEERHVFPALISAGKPEWIALVRKLQLDHALLEARWMRLGPLLHLMARGYRPSTANLMAQIRGFVELYREHMAQEDALAYPSARHLLNAEAVCTMNAEMAHRRVKATPESDDDRWE